MIIGLTGGIGSGKTSVLQLFIDKGIPVYIADIRAKKLMNSNAIIKQKIQRAFGEESYRNEKLNRAYLAKEVFGNSEKLNRLNTIVHPEVHRDFKKFIKTVNAPFIIYENAILFENGSDKWCDYIITVTAPEFTRIERVVKRDKITKQQVKDRIKHQWDETIKIAKSDFVIENIDWKTTEGETEKIYQKLIQISHSKIKKSK